MLKNNKPVLTIAASSLILAITLFQNFFDFNLWDEGFLWYGSQRLLHGELPIRDFYSYDPGRYYWSALFFKTFDNNGILLLRISASFFLMIGIFLSLFILKKEQKHYWLILGATSVTFLLWLFPRWKFFDISLSLIMLSSIAFLLRNASIKRICFCSFLFGVFIFFGRNHALYFFIVLSISMLCIFRSQSISIHDFISKTPQIFLFFLLGVSPLTLIMLSEGFANSYLESFKFILYEAKLSTISKQAPWPWTLSWPTSDYLIYFRKLLTGVYFVALPAFGVIGTILSLFWISKSPQKLKKHSTLAAASLCSLAYSHHAFSSADTSHLAQSIFPLIIGLFYICQKIRILPSIILTTIIISTSFIIMYPNQPFFNYLKNKDHWTIKNISGSKLSIPKRNAKNIDLLDELVHSFAPLPKDTFFSAPVWPGAYALHQKKSPNWEIYSLYPRKNNFEKKEIKSIKKHDVKFAIILDFPVARKEQLRYKNSHPIINDYFFREYEEINHSELKTKNIPRHYHILTRN